MTHPGAQYLAQLEASAKKATPGEWDVWREPCADKYAAVVELTEQVHCTHEFAGAVFLLNASGKCPATTGCGPTSEANATHIANASPARIAAIAEAFAAEKARADAAEAEHRFSLGLVDSAQATIASLTAKLEEARDNGVSVGIALSVAYLIRDVDQPTYAEEWWNAAGLTVEQCERLGLDEYDLEPIRATLSRLEKQEGEK